jgi:hypothetical protein
LAKENIKMAARGDDINQFGNLENSAKLSFA